jgi:hypothetical protein
MRISGLSHYAYSGCAAVAMLAGCGALRQAQDDMQPPIGAPGTMLQTTASAGHKQRFVYTGREAKFVVPSGVTALTIVADGAQGGGNTRGHYSEPPGLGGEMSAVVPVRPGEKLYVFVGGEGAAPGGYNGGGEGGKSEYGNGHYGGGASDVREGRDALRDRIFVAGGGGGAGGGYYFSGAGGAGGGVTGGRGCCPNSGSTDDGIGASGGTQGKGGLAGAGGGSGAHAGQPGTDGAIGSGGDGGASGSPGTGGYYDGGEGGGGGGGGYYGGGGGGGGAADGSCSCRGGYGGGGGGGSSYIESNAHKVGNKQGVRSRNGLVVISW